MRSSKILVIAAVVFTAATARGAFASTTLFMTAPASSLAVGDTMTVNVRIGSDVVVNAAQGTIHYPADVLSVDSISIANSIFNIWLTEPSVNASTGVISFLGGSTNAFGGGALPIFTITFRARGAGTAVVQFQDAAVTAGDGTGANILASSTALSFLVTTPGQAAVAPQAAVVPPPKQITRPATPTTTLPVAPIPIVALYPDQSKWYNTGGNFLVQWQLPADVSAVATALDQNPASEPTSSEGLFDNKTFGAISGDGIWYLHVRFKNSAGWGPTAYYRIAIDTEPPLSFAASVKEGLVTEVSAPTLQFAAQDQPSGVAFYEILVDGNIVASTTNNSFVLPSLSFGSHAIIVRAVDFAGNVTESRLSLTIAQPPFLTVGGLKITEPVFFGTIIAFIIIGILIGWWLGRKARLQRQNRAVIAERDISVAFDVIRKNIEKLAGYYSGGPVNDSQIADIKFLIQDTKEAIDKMKHYVSKGVEEIES